MKFSINFLLSFLLLTFSSLAVSSLDVPHRVALPKHNPTKLPNFAPEDLLRFDYYQQNCPDLEAIIHKKVNELVKKDLTLAAALIRLHFHDCAVRGCDASILLDHKGSEKSSKASETLRGFELINDIKAAIEKKCPKTVSCADILSVVVRDATLMVGGPFWMVPFGRKDGRVSIAKEAEMVPNGHENVTHLVQFFQSMGLNILDLVVLSGAHTIGRSTCGSIQYRLNNFNGTRKPDPSINPNYLNYLRKKCKRASEYVHLDGSTPRTFDIMYYKNLRNKMGLLSTDQMLYSDSTTSPFVNSLALQPSVFEQQFAVSMVKLGNIVSTRNGEIRVKCNRVNY